MKKSVWLWQLVGFSLCSLMGTLLHFLYEWLGGALWIAPFSGVNESTAEHMKLLFWPCFIFGCIQYFFFKERRDFWCIKARGLLLGLLLIPVIFYTYNGAIGKSPDWINIAIFFISTAATFLYEAKRLYGEERSAKPRLCFTLLCLVGAMIVIFTFIPPNIGLFRDPVTGGLGI